MLRVLLLVPFLMAVTPTFPEPTPCEHTDTSFRCVKYVSNYDADTLTVEILGVHALIGHKIGVRVRGLDVPEIKSEVTCERQVSKLAKMFVQEVLQSAKRIDLVNVGKDKYFRILADVVVDGKSLAEMVLMKGWAYPYQGDAKTVHQIDWCSRMGGVK